MICWCQPVGSSRTEPEVRYENGSGQQNLHVYGPRGASPMGRASDGCKRGPRCFSMPKLSSTSHLSTRHGMNMSDPVLAGVGQVLEGESVEPACIQTLHVASTRSG